MQLDILLDELLATYEYVICDTGATETEEFVLRLRGQGHVLITLSNDPENLDDVFARLRKGQTFAVPNQKRFLALSSTTKQVREVDPRFDLVLPYDPQLSVESQARQDGATGTAVGATQYSDAIREVYRRLSLNHALAIFVPSTLDVDCPVDNEHQVQSALQFLGSVFGGATKSDAEGVWRSEDSGLVTEQVTIVRTYVSKPALDTHLDTLTRRLRYDEDRRLLGTRMDLHILPFGTRPRTRYDDFSHTAELITQAYAATAAHLDAAVGDESNAAPPMPLEVRIGEVPRVQP